MARDLLQTIALFPLLAAQAAWVVARAERLPEPAGPRRGAVGGGRPLRLLVVGDSSAAGVGVPAQAQALAPQLATELGRDRRVEWSLAARGGATSADAPGLIAMQNPGRIDLALVVFGVNDVKNMRPIAAWRRDMTALCRLLQDGHGCAVVAFAGLPPMGDFPLLPRPLRHVLGHRARRFDAALADIAAKNGGHHLRIDLPLDPGLMARDGFHPGPRLYQEWARGLAAALRPALP